MSNFSDMWDKPAPVPTEAGPPPAPMLKSAVRSAGVHMISAQCGQCGNNFNYHTDSDYVVCPNCNAKGQWRNSGWRPGTPNQAVQWKRPLKRGDE